MTRIFEVIKGQKVLIVGIVMLNLLVSILSAWLWTSGHMPFYVVLAFSMGTLFFVCRYNAIRRFPAAVVRDNELTVYGWFGATSHIDLNAPYEFYSTGYLISVSQEQSTGAVARYVIGKARFAEFTDLLMTSRGNTGE